MAVVVACIRDPGKRFDPLHGRGQSDSANAAKVTLGRRLFFDARLSGDGSRSCATCHDSAVAFAETVARSTNLHGEPVGRNTPSVLNAASLPLVLWDGRARSLEEQALEPILSEREMGSSIGLILDVTEHDSIYRKMFLRAFGAPPTKQRIAQALAAYQRSLISTDSRFDRFLYGANSSALTATEQRGWAIFVRVNCILCHEVFHGSVHPLGGREAPLTDFAFHNLGVGFRDGIMDDVGRYRVTQVSSDWGSFKSPSLRNVAVTPPYMHDGSLATLHDVVKFYNDGGIQNPNLDPAIVPLKLTQDEMNDLVAFLEALTSREYTRIPAKQNNRTIRP